MISVNHDRVIGDDERRRALHGGDLFVDSSTRQSTAFCESTRELIADAFGGRDPEVAQYDLDVPRLRSSTSDGYPTTGIALAWHSHRDTWYSAPQAQLNSWTPVYEVSRGNARAFHLDYFDRAVPNSSETYNYYEWNQKYRRSAASQIGSETRPLPGPTLEIDLTNSLVPVAPVGGVTTFSGHHLHSSVPNTTGRTRFSIDFRIVHPDDVELGLGAPNVGANCTGSSIRDFIRASDFTPMPDAIVRRFVDGTEADGELLYRDNLADRVFAGD